MIKEDYVSFDTAKLLRAAGFDEMTLSSYGIAVRHNGKDISFDRELDLRSEGREGEIEYVEGGSIYDFWNNNSDNSESLYSRPTLYIVMKWLRDVHRIVININYIDFLEHGEVWEYEILDRDTFHRFTEKSESFTEHSYEGACEAAIRYYLSEIYLNNKI